MAAAGVVNPGRIAVLTAVMGALTGFAAGWLIGPDSEPVRLTPPAAPAAAAAASAPLASIEAAPPLVARQVPAPSLADVAGRPDLSALLRAPLSELRHSLQTALHHRADGGWLYARALARQCAALDMVTMRERMMPAELQPVAEVNNLNAQRATALREQLAAGCSQLDPDELQEAINVPPGAADPLIALMDRPAQPGSAEARDRMAAILSRPDPLMLAEMGPALLQRDGEAYVFDGRRYGGEEDRRLIEAAAALLPCSLGMVCDERDAFVWGPCVTDARCEHDSRMAFVLADAGAAEHPERRTQILAWVERLKSAVTSRDVDRFVKPPA